jgi:hypothetical protein
MEKTKGPFGTQGRETHRNRNTIGIEMSHPNNPIGIYNVGIGSSTHLDYRIGKV